MDSESLETFLAVHRRGGVSAAAIALKRTQSAISRRLALLEQEAGAPLFDRIGRGLVLSEVGSALLPYAERVAAAIGDARAAVDAAKSGAAGTVRMVTVGTLANSMLAKILRQVTAKLPNIDLRMQTATSSEVSAKVRMGEATVGLRYFADNSPDLDCRIIQEERLLVACSPSHRLAGKRLKQLAPLAKERWLAFPTHKEHVEVFASTVFAHFLTRGIGQIDSVAIDSLTAQKRLVEAGFGIALLQASAIEEELKRRELAVISVEDLQASVPVARVIRRGSYLSGGTQVLLKELEQN